MADKRICPYTSLEVAEKIITIAEMVMGMKYYPYQKEPALEIVISLVDSLAGDITITFSRQVGKTCMLSSLLAAEGLLLPELAKMFPDDIRFNRCDDHGVYRGFKDGVLLGVFAPIKDQADIAFGRMRAFLARDESEELLRQMKIGFTTANGNTVRLTNGSTIRAITASPNSHIEGHSFMQAFVDEAQEVEDSKINRSIVPMLAAYNGTLCRIGTPNTIKSHFYYGIQRNRRLYAQGARKQHFEYNYIECQKHNSMYAKFVAGEKDRIGETSDEFRMSFGVEWLLERGMFVLPEVMKQLEVSETNYKGFWSPGHSFVQPHHAFLHQAFNREGYSLVGGIDFGKMHDSTVVTIMEVDWKHPIIHHTAMTPEEYVEFLSFQKSIVGWLELYGDDYESQYHKIKEWLAGFPGLRRLTLDATGVGESLCDRFKAEYEDIEIIPFIFSNKTKSEGFKLLATDISAKRLTYPGSSSAQSSAEYKKFFVQMCDLVKDYQGEYMVCGHPDEKDAHDDFPCSVMLCNFGTQTPIDAGVEFSEENPFFRSSRNAQVRNRKRL